MNDKHKLLQANPTICKRLFGVDFVQLEQVLVKVQNRVDQYLRGNPLSKRGIEAELSVVNQLLIFDTCGNTPLFLSLGFPYGIPESYCHKIFHNLLSIKMIRRFKFVQV